MTKTANRAAARAYYREQEQKRREIVRAEAAKADLLELERLRRDLMFGKKAGEPAHELVEAIDGYVQKLTADRAALHTHNHRCG
ncbi:hypothetical protein [Bradyrhizobium sp. RDM4]|uniref:hypothetical protein n=1 Tax=Bradyrhizobium sp. RDM4 TaxID=3378765 RepID=UPI0038FBF94B